MCILSLLQIPDSGMPSFNWDNVSKNRTGCLTTALTDRFSIGSTSGHEAFCLLLAITLTDYLYSLTTSRRRFFLFSVVTKNPPWGGFSVALELTP